MAPRMTTTVRLVLAALRDADAPTHGLAIATITRLGTGTVYPILHRLEAAGWATSAPEIQPIYGRGRPPRRLYTLTPAAPTT
jgi:DNA-binding PadR family transcriptional regulator